jgi:hypothetical protein
MHLAAASGCLASDRGFVGVTNPSPPLEQSLLPSGQPSSGLVCEYNGLNGPPFSSGPPFALKSKAFLDTASAEALSAKVRQLPLGHLDGEVMNCPMDDEEVTVVALAYPDGRNINLWMATTGCATVSNGSISAWGVVSLPT